jgi:protein-S-isoprenylcysteine O-methyltransferase Ste14
MAARHRSAEIERMSNNHGLSASGISYINRMASTAIAPLCIFLLSAWRIDCIPAWIYFSVFIALNASNIALLVICNTELLNERGETQADIYKTDKLIMPLYLLFTHVVPPAVAGIELGRLHAGFFNAALMAAGIVMLTASGILENWAMSVNPFYERSIRLQTDRNQTAVVSGPYAIVRHPGYAGYLLRFLAFPLVVGSLYSVLPILIGALIIVVRTNVEDKLLMAWLPGYARYSETVKYKLLPPVW